MTKTYIIFAILLSLVFSQCLPTKFQDYLTTDVITLSKSINSTFFMYPLKKTFTSIPSIALAIVALNVDYRTYTSTGISNVIAQIITQSNIYFSVRQQNSGWSISQISVIASSNSQIILSTQKYVNTNLFKIYPLYSITLRMTNTNNIPLVNIQAKAFLSGINSKLKLSMLQFGNVTVTNAFVLVNFVDGAIFEQIWLSYFIYSLTTNNYSFETTTILLTSENSQSYDLLTNINVPQQIFYGITSFTIPFNTGQLTATIDSNFFISIAKDDQQWKKIDVLTVKYQGVCQHCPSNTNYVTFISNGYCVFNCPENSTISRQITHGGIYCRAKSISIQNSIKQVGIVSIVNPIARTTTSSGQVFNPYASITNYIPNLAVQPATTGTINILDNGTINQNLNFTSTNIPIQIFTPTNPTSTINTISTTTTTPNCVIPYSYWNGNECVCQVGYLFIKGFCAPLTPAPTITSPIIKTNTSLCSSAFSYYNGTTCLCLPGYFQISNVCTTCPQNSTWNGKYCQCDAKFYQSSNKCVQILSINCPINSYNNGLGVCICIQNYTMINNNCIANNICPSFSSLINGVCTCNSGYYKSNQQCSQCPSGAYWSNQTNKCIYVCGVNSQFNSNLNTCACLPGFGLGLSGGCQVCSFAYFLLNGYCVTCPIKAHYNITTSSCICQIGYFMTSTGVCSAKCNINEIYNPTTTLCDCKTGLNRIGGVCVICAIGSVYYQGACISCPLNSQFISGICQCNSGYIKNTNYCIRCDSLPNTYFINNYCVSCPTTRIYNTNSNQCECPFGKTLSGNKCISSCTIDQLLDTNGNCYSCLMNQVIVGGQCVCKQGYSPTSSGCGCQLTCPSNYFKFMGQCGQCPPGLIYYEPISGCICGDGYYFSDITNTCERSPIIPISCNSTSFYNNATSKCTACPSICLTCSSINTCIICQTGFQQFNGVCTAVCGDGFIRGTQICDSGSFIQPGCVNCKITAGYNCTGQPSQCTFIQVPESNNTTTTPNIKLASTPTLNSNNVYIVLLTTPTFTFPSPTQMQNFMKANFTNTIKPAVYCGQQNSPNLNKFDCLLIYPSGVPNSLFKVTFYYNYLGYSANMTVTIDPLAYLANKRIV